MANQPTTTLPRAGGTPALAQPSRRGVLGVAAAGFAATAAIAPTTAAQEEPTGDLVAHHLTLQAKLRAGWERYADALAAAEASVEFPLPLIIRADDWFTGPAPGRRPGDRASREFLEDWRQAGSRASSSALVLQSKFEARRHELLQASAQYEARKAHAEASPLLKRIGREVDQVYQQLETFETQVLEAAPVSSAVIKAKASVALRLCRPAMGLDGEAGPQVIKALEEIAGVPAENHATC